ncbi:FmdB family transcriptional regulator [candidate division TA06 bacterium B3_TA06]|uniref:FmdB family transcriptional regulator n=1 Tax=candidate division TA06 bacterium B3_TA06 TaxID=2012487 RepID=A0A532V7G2_UNCT6|nr:MAG: FmdB family transcriptional regulator [candidate division TA06 bacterium B3_TA06]
MPIREFCCRDCGASFEFLILKKSDEAKASCPKCKSRNLERLLSVFGVAGAVERPTASGGGGCSTCSSSDCSTCGR